MDPILSLEAKRLFVATALTTHALRFLRGRIHPDSDEQVLLNLARNLAEGAGLVEGRHHLSFAPSYPGLSSGAEKVGDSLRLLLGCTAYSEETPLGVVFTTLIPGRLPQVSVAPIEARIPEEWRALDSLS